MWTANAVALRYGTGTTDAIVRSILHARPGQYLLPLGFLRSKPLARVLDARYVLEVERLHLVGDGVIDGACFRVIPTPMVKLVYDVLLWGRLHRLHRLVGDSELARHMVGGVQRVGGVRILGRGILRRSPSTCSHGLLCGGHIELAVLCQPWYGSRQQPSLASPPAASSSSYVSFSQMEHQNHTPPHLNVERCLNQRCRWTAARSRYRRADHPARGAEGSAPTQRRPPCPLQTGRGCRCTSPAPVRRRLPPRAP